MTAPRCECGQFDLSGTDAYVGIHAVLIGDMTECYEDGAGRRRHSYQFRRTDGGPQASMCCDSYWFTVVPIGPYGTVARSAAYRESAY